MKRPPKKSLSDNHVVRVLMQSRAENTPLETIATSPISAEKQPQSTVSSTIVYVPPSDKAIEQFAKNVCDDLVAQGHEKFATDSLHWGLANLLKLIAELTSKQMNTK